MFQLLCPLQENQNGAKHVVTPVRNDEDLMADYDFDAMPLKGGESGQKCSGSKN
jgi:hypothetical protein